MITPEDIPQIKQIVKQMFTEQGGTSGTSSTSLHAHTGGGDGTQVQSDSLLPYSILNSSNNGTLFDATNSPSQIGSIKLFDYSNSEFLPNEVAYDWGLVLRLGNDGIDTDGNNISIWSTLHMADFYLSVHQATPQVITAGNTSTIIFDGLEDDTWFPDAAYDVLTGKFSTVLNANGKTQVYVGWADAMWYLVVASVGVAPVNGTVVPGENVEINVMINGVLFYWNRFYFPSSVDPVITTICVPILSNAESGSAIESDIHIDITNNTSDDLTTAIAGISDITWFKIKQLK